MNQESVAAARRLVTGAVVAVVFAAALAGCGSSATPVPSVAATAAPTTAATPVPTVALSPTVAPTPTPSPTPTPAPSKVAIDPTDGLKIAAPYTLAPLPDALQQTMETQMASGLGALGDAFQIGFKQVNGGTGFSILMVMGFPAGTLNDVTYKAALAGMTSSLGATFTTSKVKGVEISNGSASTGGVAVFHVGDNMMIVIAQTKPESLPVATALVNANQ